jgi:hypothetical protein
LFKGLYRTIVQQQYTVVNISAKEDDNNSNKEGKEPMSVE